MDLPFIQHVLSNWPAILSKAWVFTGCVFERWLVQYLEVDNQHAKQSMADEPRVQPSSPCASCAATESKPESEEIAMVSGSIRIVNDALDRIDGIGAGINALVGGLIKGSVDVESTWATSRAWKVRGLVT
jgi:hypothetical protein